jgi:hypothetical protein
MATHDANVVNAGEKRVVTFQDREVYSDIQQGKYILK